MFLIKKQDYNLKEHEITSESYYLNRRNILRGTLGIFFSGLSKSIISKNHEFDFEKSVKRPLTSLKTLKKYNNFFEFGTTKNIWKQAQKLNTDNWSIQISEGKKKIISLIMKIYSKNLELRKEYIVLDVLRLGQWWFHGKVFS